MIQKGEISIKKDDIFIYVMKYLPLINKQTLAKNLENLHNQIPIYYGKYNSSSRKLYSFKKKLLI